MDEQFLESRKAVLETMERYKALCDRVVDLIKRYKYRCEQITYMELTPEGIVKASYKFWDSGETFWDDMDFPFEWLSMDRESLDAAIEERKEADRQAQLMAEEERRQLLEAEEEERELAEYERLRKKFGLIDGCRGGGQPAGGDSGDD